MPARGKATVIVALIVAIVCVVYLNFQQEHTATRKEQAKQRIGVSAPAVPVATPLRQTVIPDGAHHADAESNRNAAHHSQNANKHT